MKKKYSVKEATELIEKALLAVKKARTEPNSEMRLKFLKLINVYLNEMIIDLQDLTKPPMDYGIKYKLVDCWHHEEPLEDLLFETENAFLYVQEHQEELNNE